MCCKLTRFIESETQDQLRCSIRDFEPKFTRISELNPNIRIRLEYQSCTFQVL